MNERKRYYELMCQGYSSQEADEIIDVEADYERRAQRDRELEDDWDRRERERCYENL